MSFKVNAYSPDSYIESEFEEVTITTEAHPGGRTIWPAQMQCSFIYSSAFGFLLRSFQKS